VEMGRTGRDRGEERRDGQNTRENRDTKEGYRRGAESEGEAKKRGKVEGGVTGEGR
jgi:hypothetical protein